MLLLFFLLRFTSAFSWSNIDDNIEIIKPNSNAMHEYVGFESCGRQGWSCNFRPNNYEVIYNCKNGKSYTSSEIHKEGTKTEARIWLWTARLPAQTKIFTVVNCDSLQVHTDCTKGARASRIHTFNAVNISHLNIVRPTESYTYLHDNLPFPQLPPNVNFKNVKEIQWYPSLFGNVSTLCKSSDEHILNLKLENVRIGTITQNFIHNNNLSLVEFKNVVIDKIEPNGISAEFNDVLISGSKFPDLPTNALTFKCKNAVSLFNNTFGNIQSQGINVKSKNFRFVNNKVVEISSQGLDILAQTVDISKNNLFHLDTRALESIRFGFRPSEEFLVPSKFLFKFTENIIQILNPGSLHPNWTMIRDQCSYILFENNMFKCNCENLGWIALPNAMGRKMSQSIEFYNRFVFTDKNFCIQNRNCNIKSLSKTIFNICQNTSTIMHCNKNSTISNDTIIVKTTTESEKATVTHLTTKAIEKVTNKFYEESKTIPNYSEKDDDFASHKETAPLKSYSENHTLHSKNHQSIFWFVVAPLIVILIATYLGIFKWFYSKKKEYRAQAKMYKNPNEQEEDSIIVINEHVNQLAEKNLS